MKTKPFETWEALLAHLKTTECVAYHAPMDISPRHVRAKAFKNGKVRVWPEGWKRLGASPFTADPGHLTRFGQVVEKCGQCGQHFEVGDHCGCGFYAEKV